MAEENNKENEVRNEALERNDEGDVTQPETKPAVSVKVEEKNEIKRQYIATFILNSSMNASEIDTARTELNERIISHDGNVSTSICQESSKNFAYPIEKTSQGYFCECVFEADTEKIRDIENEFKNDTKVIRYMMEVKKAPSKKQQKRRVSQYRPRMDAAGAGKRGASDKTESSTEADKREKISVEEIERKIDEIIDNI